METETLHRFLSACDEHDVSITFNVVGHLLMDSCNGEHDCLFPNYFDVCPKTDVDTDPLLYAPDLIEAIRSADVSHEICTHTFSHIDCHAVSEDIVKWELRKAREVHQEFGLETPTSFIAPWHHNPSNEILVEAGIGTVRKPDPDYNPPSKPVARHGWSLMKEHPTYEPQKTDGILHTYCPPHPTLSSQHLPTGQLPPSPVFQVFPIKTRQRIHERYLIRGLQKAIKRDAFVHYWTHLYNLSNEVQLKPVTSFLDELGRYQNRGDVNVKTMDKLSPVLD